MQSKLGGCTSPGDPSCDEARLLHREEKYTPNRWRRKTLLDIFSPCRTPRAVCIVLHLQGFQLYNGARRFSAKEIS
jgi:hypothetical protein